MSYQSCRNVYTRSTFIIGKGVQQLLQNSTANLVPTAERSFLNLENSVLKNESACNCSAMALSSLDFLFCFS